MQTFQIEGKKFNFTITQRKVLRKKYNFAENDLVFICVARVDPMKNYNNFITEISKLNNV